MFIENGHLREKKKESRNGYISYNYKYEYD